ncbi:calcium-binding protein [Oleispirillum naphthae]|uniref:beta strand repeat-containing protein n=1 Tax=Oleispirillum naphthae TaxID=2838853 RepID=UPI0030826814
MPQTATIIKADASGGYKLPLARGDVARIDVVDVDLVVQGKDGTRYILAEAGLAAMSSGPSAVVFSDGAASAAQLMESVGHVETPDTSIPVMSSLTEHDAKTTSGPKSFHGDGTDTTEAGGQPTQEQLNAQAEAQTGSDQVSPLATASDATVEQLIQKVSNSVEQLHNKAADPVPEQPYEPPAAASPGVGAAPNPVSLTPLTVISLGNVVGDTAVGSNIYYSGGPSGTDSQSGYEVRDPAQFSIETVTGTGGNDVIYADGTAVGGVSYTATGTVAGNADLSSATATFAKEMTIQISGYFTTLTTITISGLPSNVSLVGTSGVGDSITQNADGSWDVPISFLTDSESFKIVYTLYEPDAANPVHQEFTMTVAIDGITRAEAFTSTSNFTVQVRDADDATDISQTDGGGNTVYVLPAQGTPNTIDAGAGNDTIHAGYGNDTITAGTGDDIVYAGYGADTVYGGGGADVVYVNLGTLGDLVYGDDGADTIYAGTGSDTLYGGAGDDVISASDGANTIDGGEGVNVITAGSGNDVITAGAGDDTITAGEGANAITAGDGANTVTVGSGADTITTGSGNDSITAGEGANTIVAGDGVNSITAGAGNDTVTTGSGADYISIGDGVNTVTAGDGANTVITGAGADSITTGSGDDTITAGDGNNVIVGGDGDNTVTTGAGADSITTGAGADTIYAGGGNDIIHPGAGANDITGDTGNDTLSFSELTVAVTASLTSNTATISGVGSTFTGIENLEGSAQGDTLTGDAAANVISGLAGDDALNGGGGADTVLGGAGDDTIDIAVASAGISVDGGADNDTVNVSAGVVGGTLTGGDGSDTLIITDTGTAEHRIDLGTGGGTGGIIDDTRITDFTTVRFIDSTDDRIAGSSRDETFYGGGGNDTLEGNGGNDVLFGEAGADSLVGGDGNDILFSSAIAIGSLADLSHITVTGSDSSNNYLYGNAGDDVFFGSNATSSMFGGVGADTFYGGSGTDYIFTDDNTFSSSSDGADTAYGGGGNDRFYASEGADEFYGGALNASGVHVDNGNADFVYYTWSPTGVTIVLDGAGNSTTASGGYADGDELYGIERIYGSNYDGDVLTVTGTSGNTRYLYGQNGDDILTGGDSVDYLDGGNNNDILYGNAGNDNLYGQNQDDTLYGGDGNDYLDGGSQNDTLYGGVGDDRLYGQNNDDTLYGGDGNDTLDGGNQNDMVYGEAGDDTLIYAASSSAGSDILDGGTGNDTLDCSGSANTVKVFLVDTTDGIAIGDRPSSADGVVSGGDGFVYSSGGSIYSTIKADSGEGNSSIENVTGGSSDDVLVGDSAANTLIGGAGADHIYGKGGADVLDGGTDDDTIHVAASELASLVSVSGGASGDDTLVITGLATGALTDAVIAKLTSIEYLDVRDSTVDATYALTATQVQNIVDNGAGSTLTFQLDSGDIFTPTAAGSDHVSAATAGGHTTYSYWADAGESSLLAKVEVYQ